MKKTLMCATAAAALVSVGAIANAQDDEPGWYTRADIGYTFAGNLDHDPEPGIPGSLAGDSTTDNLLGGWLGAGYDFGNDFRFEITGGYRAGDLNASSDFNGAPLGVSGDSSVEEFSDANIQVWDAMANLLYDFENEGFATPYIGAGVGIAGVKADVGNLVAVSPAGAQFGINGCLLYTSPSPRDRG